MTEAEQAPLKSALCWKALGEYGVFMGRNDLIHIGFEKALAAYPSEHHESRIKTAKRYLKTVKENRLLAVDIERRISEWTAKTEEAFIPVVRLRSEPVEASDDNFREIFNLDQNLRPLKYIENGFEDRGEVIFDRTTGLTWHKKGSEDWMTYEAAGEYVNQLNQDRFFGFSDWRLPTVNELASLLEPEKESHGLYCDSVFEGKSFVDWYWTADTRAGGGAWLVYFLDGGVLWFNLNLDEYVRVCRP